jgi:acyl carrier protein
MEQIKRHLLLCCPGPVNHNSEEEKNHKGDTMSDPILEKLGAFIAKEILKQPNRIVKTDEPLLSSGLVDSFHLVDLSLFVENNFGVRIDDAELNASTFDTLNQLVNLIKSRK